MCYSTDTCLTQQWHIGVVEMSYNKPVLSLTFISSCLLALSQWVPKGERTPSRRDNNTVYACPSEDIAATL